MKIYDNKHIKNIALLGSAKSGKTTLAETMLFEAGIINRRGTVETNNTVSDYHEIEHEKGNSIYATSLHTEWRDYKINIIDTPGYDDFIGEVASTIRVADTSVVLINAQHGVEVGTEITWQYIDQFQKPAIFAINQLDHNKANFEKTMESINTRFGDSITLMQYPLNPGEGFNCIIDLLKMVMYKFGPEGGKPEKVPIPDSEKEKADALHNELVEKAAENDENLMELYFDKGNLDEDELRKGLKIGMLNHQVFPVFCLSAKLDMGSGRMMGFIDNVAPAAIELYPEKTESDTEVNFETEKPPVLFVFKTLIEPNLGKVSFFKVLRGEVNVGDILTNEQTGTQEHLNQLLIMDGKNRNSVNKLSTGDIGATLKLKDTETNHTLHDKSDNIAIKPIVFPKGRMRIAIEANNKRDDEKLSEALKKMHQEDPTIVTEFSSELKQLLIYCQGEMQLTSIKWKLQNLYNIEVNFITPKIPYRETIRKEAEASYRHKKQSGGAGQFGEVYMKIGPYYEGMAKPSGFNIRDTQEIALDWGGKLVFYNCIVGGVIDARFIPSILKGVMEKMQEGPITGSYVRDIYVVVYDGKMHPVDSNDIAFKIAGMMAFKEAFRNASPQILEPLYDLQVMVPEDLMGDVMSDLQGRRAIIMGLDAKENYQIINAKVPMVELDSYTTALRSITHGKAGFTSNFNEYAPVTGDIQKKLAQVYSEESN